MGASAQLTSSSSDRVKSVKALHSRAGRRKAGRFIVEGPQGVRSALSAGVVIHEMYVDDNARAGIFDVIDEAYEAGVEIVTAMPHVLAAMGETDHPQGVIAVCSLLDTFTLADVLETAAPIVILDQVADPGNVGTIIRTADAVGAAGVLLTPGCADIHNGKVVRATAGSLFHVPVVSDLPMADIIAGVHDAGRALAVATWDGEEGLFEAADSRMVCHRTCWVIGSEAHGVGHEAREAADITVRIPMAEGIESLNAGVSASVVLYVIAHAARSGVFGPRGFR